MLMPARGIMGGRVWMRIMFDHARFIAHLLDPDEEALLARANEVAKTFWELLETPPSDGDPVFEAANEIVDFKTAAEQGIEAGQIRSIIRPILKVTVTTTPAASRPAVAGGLSTMDRCLPLWIFPAMALGIALRLRVTVTLGKFRRLGLVSCERNRPFRMNVPALSNYSLGENNESSGADSRAVSGARPRLR
jgi:hypothetical protein